MIFCCEIKWRSEIRKTSFHIKLEKGRLTSVTHTGVSIDTSKEVINPGDIIVISPKDAPYVAVKAKEKLQQEQATFKKMQRVHWIDRHIQMRNLSNEAVTLLTIFTAKVPF